jgi:hypothetical protein
MAIWETVTSWFNANAKQYTYVTIPKDRVTQEAGQEYDDSPLDPSGSYFRLWLSDMFLTKSVAWGKQWFPAVHSEVHLQFGGQTAAFSKVAQPPQDQLSKGVRGGYRRPLCWPSREPTTSARRLRSCSSSPGS